MYKPNHMSIQGAFVHANTRDAHIAIPTPSNRDLLWLAGCRPLAKTRPQCVNTRLITRHTLTVVGV